MLEVLEMLVAPEEAVMALPETPALVAGEVKKTPEQQAMQAALEMLVLPARV